ncbi:MAG: acyl carrier protein [Lachnospiraceae bacterium]|nr:acyl carrier protein [Lachnospiraceae bacterium]
MLEKVISVLEDQLGIDVAGVNEETSFQEDLRIDSLDLFEVVTALEDEYEIEIPQEELDNLKTVGDVVKFLQSKGIE